MKGFAMPFQQPSQRTRSLGVSSPTHVLAYSELVADEVLEDDTDTLV